MDNISYIKEKFLNIKDFRHPGYVEHKLSDVLIIIMCAILCGLDQLCDIVMFSQNKKAFFKQNLGIENIPSKSTFSRILNMINGEEVGKVIIDIMSERVEFVRNIIAVDGKTIRSTLKRPILKLILFANFIVNAVLETAHIHQYYSHFCAPFSLKFTKTI